MLSLLTKTQKSMLEISEKGTTEQDSTSQTKLHKKQIPLKHKVAISDDLIASTISTEHNEVTEITENPALSNEEMVEQLHELVVIKQAKFKKITQKAAQLRCMDVINTARQYISMLKDGSVEMDDEDEEMDVFEMIYHNARQVALKISNALVITGDAGMGKTHEVLAAVKFLNDVKPQKDEIEEDEVLADVVTEDGAPVDTDGDIEDTDETTEEIEGTETEEPTDEVDVPGENFTLIRKKAPPFKKGEKSKKPVVPTASSLNTTQSGYYIASGTCTAAALYELLWQYRNKLIIFNDLDSILKDEDSVNLLKAALDTYPIRELSKMTKGNSFNSLGMTDAEMWDEYEITQKVPNQFKFSGSIIFISNIHEDKFDKALISRSLHVEVRLSKKQVIERMHKLMWDIRAEVSVEHKLEALEHLEFLTSNYICKFDLNLRELIHAIDYRTTHGEATIKLGNKELLLWKQLLRGRIVKSKKKY